MYLYDRNAFKFGEGVHLNVLFDTSGGMPITAVIDFFDYIKEQLSHLSWFKLSLYSFDTELYFTKTFTKDNIADLDKVVLKGGGGTIFRNVYENLQQDSVGHHTIIITDGFFCDNTSDMVDNNATIMLLPYTGNQYMDVGWLPRMRVSFVKLDSTPPPTLAELITNS